MEAASIAIRRQGRTVILTTAAHNDTTRCYPRTLSEAFPLCDARSAQAIHCASPYSSTWAWAMAACTLAAAVVILITA